MTASNANAPVLQFNQTDGTPAVGFWLYSYEAGTNTPVDTYQNFSATVLNTNPIELDEYGMAKVWITVPTKLILKTADTLTTVFTVDNLIPNDLNIIDENGNFLLTFTGVPNAVNYFNITNASTGTPPIFQADGTDAAIDMAIRAKGAGDILLGGPSSTGVVLENSQPIRDEHGRELIAFSATTGAVNEITITNAITGTAPTIAATGDDTNIDLNISAKGTGTVNINGNVTIDGPIFNIPGSATESGEVRLYEDTDNGTNYIGLKAPASVAANLSFKVPGADGAANTIMVTDGSANLSFANKTTLAIASSGANTDITSVRLNNTGLAILDTNASNTLTIVPGSDLTGDRTLTVITGDSSQVLDVTGGVVPQSRLVSAAGLVTGGGDLSADRTFTVTAANQSNMETGTSTTVAVVPGVMQYHQGVAKAWLRLVYSTGTPTISMGYNIASITDTGTGEATPVFTTAQSGTTYCVVAARDGTVQIAFSVGVSNRTTAQFQLSFRNDAGVATDLDGNIVVFGDL
jgi:hypothetical protein